MSTVIHEPEAQSAVHRQQPSEKPGGLWQRVRAVSGLLFGLRRHDFRAAATFMRQQYANEPWPVRLAKFTGWAARQMFIVIPDALTTITFARPISRTPVWLLDANPLRNHPWAKDPEAQLTTEAEVVVIGAGFTGASAAYHWSKKAPADRRLVVIEMDDAADGASGRNQGTIVMGRYFAMVRETVLDHLPNVRPDMSSREHRRLAEQFADRYCKAAYHNAELIAQTIRAEGFEVDYARNGWVQERLADQQEALKESVEAGHRWGHTDWIAIDPDRVRQESGMQVNYAAGFSQKAATWHPAKWVWSLLAAALHRPNVSYFSRTRMTRVERRGEHYMVHTTRGSIQARQLLFAVEACLPKLDPRFHDVILPHQEQCGSGLGGPAQMPSDNSITGRFYFGARRGKMMLVGSDSTRVPDGLAGIYHPSRFLTKFALSEYKRLYGRFVFRLTNEWAGSVGYSADEYPLVGKIDSHGQYMIGGMCGSGSGVAFNAARCIVNRILGRTDEPDDYPEAYFAPSRLLDPKRHPWPKLEE